MSIGDPLRFGKPMVASVPVTECQVPGRVRCVGEFAPELAIGRTFCAVAKAGEREGRRAARFVRRDVRCSEGTTPELAFGSQDTAGSVGCTSRPYPQDAVAPQLLIGPDGATDFTRAGRQGRPDESCVLLDGSPVSLSILDHQYEADRPLMDGGQLVTLHHPGSVLRLEVGKQPFDLGNDDLVGPEERHVGGPATLERELEDDAIRLVARAPQDVGDPQLPGVAE
jgi:hypothetical protein